MLDTTKYSVDDLRELLIRKYNLPRDEVEALKPKSNVVAKLRELEADDQILDEAEEVKDELILPINQQSQVPIIENTINYLSEGWTEHVLSQLRESELSDGFPKVDGLRRLAEVFNGPILGVKSKVCESPSLNNNFTATVRVRVITSDQVVDGCASASPADLPIKYAKHPVAVAESMAEGRAYRKLLRLSNIISAEELTPSNEQEAVADYDGLINTAQTKTIDKIASELNINVEKWLLTHNIKLGDFNRIQKAKAIKLCEELNSLRASGEVPEELKGFDFNWRT